MALRTRLKRPPAEGLRDRRRKHGGQDSADGERVKAASRASGGAQAPALTRSTAAETLKARNSTLTSNTVAEARSEAEPRRRLQGTPPLRRFSA